MYLSAGTDLQLTYFSVRASPHLKAAEMLKGNLVPVPFWVKSAPQKPLPITTRQFLHLRMAVLWVQL